MSLESGGCDRWGARGYKFVDTFPRPPREPLAGGRAIHFEEPPALSASKFGPGQRRSSGGVLGMKLWLACLLGTGFATLLQAETPLTGQSVRDGQGEIRTLWETQPGDWYLMVEAHNLGGPWLPVPVPSNPQQSTSNALSQVFPINQGINFFRLVRLDPPPANPHPADLVWIRPGTFTMGSPTNEIERAVDEGPQTFVTLVSGFFMGRCEVRQREYLAVMGSNPSAFSGMPERPVEQVSWEDATNYCVRLTDLEMMAGRLPQGWEYRLPTEAQWEYACRAGTTTATAFGDALGSPEANFNGNFPYGGAPTGRYLGTTMPVGSYSPNSWGLHDMHGNVFEWCHDWYGPRLSGGNIADPDGPDTGTERLLRGGCWITLGRHCRSAYRVSHLPSTRRDRDGFRVALVRVR